MSGDEADISSGGETSFDENIPLPLSPMIKGTDEPFEVVLKGGRPWGFTLMSRPDSKTSIRVAEVDEYCQDKAGKHRQIKVGDYLLQVNGVCCGSIEEAEQLIDSAFRTLTLQLWRGTNEPLSAPVQSVAFFQKSRELSEHEHARQQVQDDSALFTKSKGATSFRMKPRQRRIESFHTGRKGTSQSNTSSPPVTSSSIFYKQPKNVETSPATQTIASIGESSSTKPNLKFWATEHDLSSRQPVIMLGSHMTQNATLVAAKSSPSLNQNDMVNASRSHNLKLPLNVVKSTPDIPEQVNYENITSPIPKSPLWYQQKLPNRSSFEFSSLSKRRDGSPRNSYSSGSPRNSYSGNSPQGSYAFMPNYTQSPVLGFAPMTVPSNMLSQPSDSCRASSRDNVSQSQKLSSPYTSSYDDMPSPSKNYDRWSLPPQALLLHRPELMRDLNKSETARTLTSMPVTHEEDEVDKEILEFKPRPPNDLDLRPMYSPPAPPVRDISSLKYVTHGKTHEKYPSWPVTSAQQPQNLGPPIDTETHIAKGLDHNSESDNSDKLSNDSLKADVKISVSLERKNSEEKQRNQSDPGFKQRPKKSFYTTRKPVEPAYENRKPEGERFKEFCRQSKPGYPPPKLDPDGHNYGDEKYSIPSPPERDIPEFVEKSIVEKISAVISNYSVHHPHKYNSQYNITGDGGPRLAKSDSATSPLQQPQSNKMSGSYFQQAMNAQNLLHSNSSQGKGTVDSGTSPLQSPIGGKDKLWAMSANSKTEPFISPTEKSRSLIIRQMPYYNTSTQTDESNQSKTENTESGHQSAYGPLSISSVSSGASNLISEMSSQSSGIGSMNFSDHSSAPMLRKLSEEYYQGKLGMVHIDKRMSAASAHDDIRSSHLESHYGGMKEAESYSSVVIHPHESSGPFGRDDLGSSPSLSISRPEVLENEHHNLYKARHSMDAAFHPNKSSLSIPSRNVHETRFPSESNLSSNQLSFSQSLMHLNRPDSALANKNQSNPSVHSTSTSSRLRSSMEARSSGSHSGSDSSTPGVARVQKTDTTRLDSDSVFSYRTSPVVRDSGQPIIHDVSSSNSIGVSRRESMKHAYGTYDENEHHYSTPYAHQKSTGDALSSALNAYNVVHGRSKSFNEYLSVHSNLNGAHLGHIVEEDPEIRWQDVVQKSQSLSKKNTTNYENLNSDQSEVLYSQKSSESDGEEHKVSKSDMRRTASEKFYPLKDKKKNDTSKSENSSSGESSKGNKSSDKEFVQKPSSSHRISDPDLKKLQQQAVLDFVERKKNKGSDSSESQIPKTQDCVPDCNPLTYPDMKLSIDSTVISSPPPSPLADITKRYNFTKAQRKESLRRTMSITSNSSKDSKGDYPDTKRLENRNYVVTEWSRLRSQDGMRPRHSLSVGSDVGVVENLSSSPATSPDGDAYYKGASSETIPKHILAEQDRLEGNLSQPGIPAPGSHDNMVTAPIYHNMGGEYPRRPPPPVPGALEDAPPALPPRSLSRMSNGKSESFLLSRDDLKLKEDMNETLNLPNFGVVNARTGRWDSGTGTLHEDAYAQQLRKQARCFSEQHRPMSMQVVSMKSTVQVSLSQSYKQEPATALEATPMSVTSTSQSDTKQITSDLHHSPPLRNLVMPEPLQLPTPMKNGETEIPMDLNITADFPPPPGFMEDIPQDQNNERCADDSYGSYKTWTVPHEVGKYKKTVSDSVISALQEHRLLNQEPNLNEIAEIPNKPHRKRLENKSPTQSQKSNIPGVNNSEIASTNQSHNIQVPVFHVTEIKPVQSVQKSVDKSLPVSSASKIHGATNIATSAGSFVSTVVQRPTMHPQDSPQEETRPSVKDRVKNIEVFSQPPLSAKLNALRPVSATNITSELSDEKNHLGQRARASSVSLQKLESSVKSSNSFKDRLRPVVQKTESGHKQTNVPVEIVPVCSDHANTIPSMVDGTSGIPPIVPSRTYRQKVAATSEALPRKNSFQNKRTHDNKSTNGASHSNMQGHNNSRSTKPASATASELKQNQGHFVPEPQVSSRSHIGQWGNINEQQTKEQNTDMPSPESRLTSKFNGGIQSGLKRNYDSSFSSGKISNSGSQSNTSFGSDCQNTDRNVCQYKYDVENAHSDKVGNSNRTESRVSHSVGQIKPSHDERSPGQVAAPNIGSNKNWKRDQTCVGNVSTQKINNCPSLNQKTNFNLQNSKYDNSNFSVFNKMDNLSPQVNAIHTRQPSAEELECDQKAKELAQVLKDDDKELSNVLQSDSKKVRMHFLDGIVPLEPDNERQHRSTPRGDRQLEVEKKTKEDNLESTSPMPSNYYVSPPKAMIELEICKSTDSNQLIEGIQDNDSLAQKKEELLERMIKKVNILKDDKKELLGDIAENESLGNQVMSIVEKKCRSQQVKEKYKSYIEDMDTIIRLLLKLSGLLARAENTIQGLDENTDERIKKMTYDKRDRLYQQHEDAKVLKLDIDKRSNQVETFLHECLTAVECDDYHHYIKMKSIYTIQMQELEDKITLGNEQITALQKSMPDKFKSVAGP